MFGASHAHRRGVRTALLLLAGSPRHVADAAHGDDHGDVRQSLRTVDVIEDAGAEPKHSREPRPDLLLDDRGDAAAAPYISIDGGLDDEKASFFVEHRGGHA